MYSHRKRAILDFLPRSKTNPSASGSARSVTSRRLAVITDEVAPACISDLTAPQSLLHAPDPGIINHRDDVSHDANDHFGLAANGGRIIECHVEPNRPRI